MVGGSIVPLSYVIDSENSMVRLELSGALQIEEGWRTVEQLLSDSAFGPGLHILSDHSGLSETATPELVKAIVPLLERIGKRLGPFKCALVVPDDASFGMGRMAGTYAEPTPATVCPFRTKAEAEAWLRDEPA
jgi:hypothetical protein